jgi:hypothetical protein
MLFTRERRRLRSIARAKGKTPLLRRQLTSPRLTAGTWVTHEPRSANWHHADDGLCRCPLRLGSRAYRIVANIPTRGPSPDREPIQKVAKRDTVSIAESARLTRAGDSIGAGTAGYTESLDRHRGAGSYPKAGAGAPHFPELYLMRR